MPPAPPAEEQKLVQLRKISPDNTNTSDATSLLATKMYSLAKTEEQKIEKWKERAV